MRTLGTSLSLALLALAACGNDSGSNNGNIDAPVIIDAPDPDAPIDSPPPPPDAPNYDFSCAANTTAPTTAADPISLAGVAQEIVLDLSSPSFVSIRAASGAALEACIDDCQQPSERKGNTNSGNDGSFVISNVATGGTPLDGYLTLTKSGNQPTRIYPAYPLDSNVAGIPGLMMATFLYQNIDNPMTGITHMDGNAIVGAFLQDCAGTPVGGATLTITRGGTSLGTFQDTGSFAAQGAGGYLAFNITPDPANDPDGTVITASYMGTTFLSRTVRALPDTLTLTQIKPGYPN